MGEGQPKAPADVIIQGGIDGPSAHSLALLSREGVRFLVVSR